MDQLARFLLHVQLEVPILLLMQQDILSPTSQSLLNESLSNNLHWISILTRLSIGTLFLCAAIVKTPLGIPGIIAYYSSLLDKSLLPAFLVKIHAALILFLEFGLAFWLLSGWQLRLAWKVAGLALISLAVGMIFAGKYDVASDNYIYVFLCAVGLVASPFDRWVVRSK
jgi:methylamine utilization protein MauE